MAVYSILKIGDPFLREKAKKVAKITPQVEKLLTNLADTLNAEEGLGLAAPQIGVGKRVIVVDIGKGLIELINPEITEAEGEETATEGCLSIPGFQGEVKRAARVNVTGLNRSGEIVNITGEGLLARVLQHEIDHLEGILFVDRVDRK